MIPILSAGEKFRCVVCGAVRTKMYPVQKCCLVSDGPNCRTIQIRRRNERNSAIAAAKRVRKGRPQTEDTYRHLVGEMKRLYASGLSGNSIARKLEGKMAISGTVVIDLLRRNGVKIRAPRRYKTYNRP